MNNELIIGIGIVLLILLVVKYNDSTPPEPEPSPKTERIGASYDQTWIYILAAVGGLLFVGALFIGGRNVFG